MTSAMPSSAAASCSSRVRTPARLPSGTSAGSLTDPRSPREAQRSTTLAPASASRANVPPHVSDSSSGWAKTARMVRPSTPLCTVRLDDPFVHRQIPFDHPHYAEPLHRLLPDAAAIEIEHARQLVHHLLEIVEHDAR